MNGSSRTETTRHERRPRLGLLFDYDWDALAHQALAPSFHYDRAGFDLFSFPSNARLINFDLGAFAAKQARRARQRGDDSECSAGSAFAANERWRS